MKAKLAILLCALLAVPTAWAEDRDKPAAKPEAKKEVPATAAGGQSSGANSSSSVFADVPMSAVAVAVGSVVAVIAIANSGGSSSTTQH